MDFTTWRGIYWSGVGIGMGRRMVNQLLQIQRTGIGDYRVMRGGLWGDSAVMARCATRYGETRPSPTATLGFVVRGGFNFSSFMF